MRVKKLSVLALAAVAGLSLTACGSGGGDADGKGSAPAVSGRSGTTGITSTARTAGTALNASFASSPLCRTDHLTLSAARTGTKNELVVNLRNDGARRCAMRGFPGVQLIGPEGLGDIGPDARRTNAPTSTVTVAHGEETRFLLRWTPHHGGASRTYTRMCVTPPNETICSIVNLGRETITLPAHGPGSADVYVDPIGYHTGFGK